MSAKRETFKACPFLIQYPYLRELLEGTPKKQKKKKEKRKKGAMTLREKAYKQ